MNAVTKLEQIWEYRGFEIVTSRSSAELIEGVLRWDGERCPNIELRGTAAIWVTKRARAWIDAYYGGANGKCRLNGTHWVLRLGRSEWTMASWDGHARGWKVPGGKDILIPGEVVAVSDTEGRRVPAPSSLNNTGAAGGAFPGLARRVLDLVTRMT